MEFLHIIILLFQFFFHSLIFLFPTGTLRKLGPTANTRMYEWTLMEKECINCFFIRASASVLHQSGLMSACHQTLLFNLLDTVRTWFVDDQQMPEKVFSVMTFNSL